jgi:hypothetical protein
MPSAKTIEAGLLMFIGTALLSGCEDSSPTIILPDQSGPNSARLTPVSEVVRSKSGHGLFITDTSNIDFLTTEQRREMMSKFESYLNPAFNQKYPLKFITVGYSVGRGQIVPQPEIRELYSNAYSDNGVSLTMHRIGWDFSSNHDNTGRLTQVRLATGRYFFPALNEGDSIRIVSPDNKDRVAYDLFNLASDAVLNWERKYINRFKGPGGSQYEQADNVRLGNGQVGSIEAHSGQISLTIPQ